MEWMVQESICKYKVMVLSQFFLAHKIVTSLFHLLFLTCLMHISMTCFLMGNIPLPRYGEGWDFGEVAKNGRGVNASQFNICGTGIGRYSICF